MRGRPTRGAAGEGGHGRLGIVVGAVEAPVHDPLDPPAQRVEQRGRGQRGARHRHRRLERQHLAGQQHQPDVHADQQASDNGVGQRARDDPVDLVQPDFKIPMPSATAARRRRRRARRQPPPPGRWRCSEWLRSGELKIDENGVHIGRDGWLFLAAGSNEALRLLTDQDLFVADDACKWAAKLSERKKKRIGDLGAEYFPTCGFRIRLKFIRTNLILMQPC